MEWYNNPVILTLIGILFVVVFTIIEQIFWPS